MLMLLAKFTAIPNHRRSLAEDLPYWNALFVTIPWLLAPEIGSVLVRWEPCLLYFFSAALFFGSLYAAEIAKIHYTTALIVVLKLERKQNLVAEGASIIVFK